MARSTVVVVSAVASLVVIGAVVFVQMDQPGAEVVADDPSPDGHPELSAAPPLDPARARELEAGVNAREADGITDTVLLGRDDHPQDVAEQVLPEGAVLRLDDDTFTSTGQHTATIVGHIDQAGEALSATILLVHDEGVWWLAGSDEPGTRP